MQAIVVGGEEGRERTDALCKKRRRKALSLSPSPLLRALFHRRERYELIEGSVLPRARGPVEAWKRRAERKRLPCFFSPSLSGVESEKALVDHAALSPKKKKTRSEKKTRRNTSHQMAQPPAAALRLLGSALRRLGGGVDAVGAAIQGRFASPEGGKEVGIEELPTADARADDAFSSNFLCLLVLRLCLSALSSFARTEITTLSTRWCRNRKKQKPRRWRKERR